MKKFVFTIIGMMISLMVAAQVNASYPDSADYVIKGRITVEKNAQGKVVYTLDSIQRDGIFLLVTLNMEGKTENTFTLLFMKLKPNIQEVLKTINFSFGNTIKISRSGKPIVSSNQVLIIMKRPNRWL